MNKAPFVCNGCDSKHSCRKTRFEHYGKQANDEYKETLVSSRKGIDMQSDEFNRLNQIVVEEVKEKGHSFSMVVRNHPNEFSKTNRTLYNYLENGYLDINNLDVPRKVRYKQRKKNETPIIRKTKIREGETYLDFLKYKEEFFIINGEEANIVQMDTVIGKFEDKKCFLTLYFKNSKLMLMFLIRKYKPYEVKRIFNLLKKKLGTDTYKELFEIILTDNEWEFSKPLYIEIDQNTGEKISNVFFSEPYCSWQKGGIERNHEFIRYIIPKGITFDNLTDKNIMNMMNNINNVKRKRIDYKTPYLIFKSIYRELIANSLQLPHIDEKDVDLSYRILK